MHALWGSDQPRFLGRSRPTSDDGLRIRRCDRGAVLIEFAVLMPLLIIMTMGVLQTGIILFQQQALHSAAREGAREAALPASTAAEITQTARDALVGVNFADDPAIVITPADNQPCLDREGESVTVQLSATTTLDIPLLAGQTVNLDSSATFRCE